MQKFILKLVFLIIPFSLTGQSSIQIDGNFDDWINLPVLVSDSANDAHDTDWFGDGLPAPIPRKYSDVDILEVKFTHDRDNLYGYIKAKGIVGHTSRAADGQKAGRYYFIITIDVDNNDSTGYPLAEGNYWPNSTGYDMNMEVEFYDGSFNTGHYIHHDFMSDADLMTGRDDLAKHIIRLGPGTYKYYLQWVTFPDSTFIYVQDKGPVIEGGIIEVAVSPDGHEAEMKAPMWGFFQEEDGTPIIQLGDTIDISFSLEGSGELSESAVDAGYNGTKSIWGSDTADPIVGYYLADLWNSAEPAVENRINSFCLNQNYPNPFNGQTTIHYNLEKSTSVQLLIINSAGQIIKELINSTQSAGNHQITWNGAGENCSLVSSGIYFAVLKSAGMQEVKRVVFLK